MEDLPKSELLEAKKRRLRSLESIELMCPEDLSILALRRKLKAEIAELERRFEARAMVGGSD